MGVSGGARLPQRSGVERAGSDEPRAVLGDHRVWRGALPADPQGVWRPREVVFGVAWHQAGDWRAADGRHARNGGARLGGSLRVPLLLLPRWQIHGEDSILCRKSGDARHAQGLRKIRDGVPRHAADADLRAVRPDAPRDQAPPRRPRQRLQHHPPDPRAVRPQRVDVRADGGAQGARDARAGAQGLRLPRDREADPRGAATGVAPPAPDRAGRPVPRAAQGSGLLATDWHPSTQAAQGRDRGREQPGTELGSAPRERAPGSLQLSPQQCRRSGESSEVAGGDAGHADIHRLRGFCVPLLVAPAQGGGGRGEEARRQGAAGSGGLTRHISVPTCRGGDGGQLAPRGTCRG
mmetsp:Transcript_52854/g.125800  ORF Transcript_52854/g.125800 Transcript_52854/m.125800 type:complete len:350 (+) Transcript_52854:77-1126(+)